jgi:hypothetical protein
LFGVPFGLPAGFPLRPFGSPIVLSFKVFFCNQIDLLQMLYQSVGTATTSDDSSKVSTIDAITYVIELPKHISSKLSCLEEVYIIDVLHLFCSH